MSNAEDSCNRKLLNYSYLTYCFNVSLMVHENFLFWYITSYSEMSSQNGSLEPKVSPLNLFHFKTHFIDIPWKRSILIYHNQYFIWNYEVSSQNRLPEPKVSSYDFFPLRPHFIDSPWKRSILIYHNLLGIWNFEMSSQISSIEL